MQGDQGQEWGDESANKKCLRLPESHQKLGERHRMASPSQPSEGATPANTWILESPDLWDNKFLLLKSFNLWYFCYRSARKLMQYLFHTLSSVLTLPVPSPYLHFDCASSFTKKCSHQKRTPSDRHHHASKRPSYLLPFYFDFCH